jgi:hypothetical protein
MNPEILEELEILDDERMNLGIGPYPVEQTMCLCCAFSRRAAPAAGWFMLIPLWHGHCFNYLNLSQILREIRQAIPPEIFLRTELITTFSSSTQI